MLSASGTTHIPLILRGFCRREPLFDLCRPLAGVCGHGVFLSSLSPVIEPACISISRGAVSGLMGTAAQALTGYPTICSRSERVCPPIDGFDTSPDTQEQQCRQLNAHRSVGEQRRPPIAQLDLSPRRKDERR